MTNVNTHQLKYVVYACTDQCKNHQGVGCQVSEHLRCRYLVCRGNFLCFLSGKYPFFKALNDHIAMMEIVTLFVTERCVTVVKLLGKELGCSPTHHAQSLAIICEEMDML